MARDINFYHVLDTHKAYLPLEFSDCIQVQNVSGGLLMVVDGVRLFNGGVALVNPDNELVNSLLAKKKLKLRQFTTSSTAELEPAAQTTKKRGRKKAQSISSPQQLDGAVADLASVISGDFDKTVAATGENVEQLLNDDSEFISEADGEGSPETDN